MRVTLAASIVFVSLAGPTLAAGLDVQAINDAQWEGRISSKGIDPALVKAQVLLGRAHFSPGEIDGKLGDNFRKAVAAFFEQKGIAKDSLNEETWRKLTSISEQPVIIEYVLKDDDVRGPFVEQIPKKLEDMKNLASLAYTSPAEEIAEKFHMSQELLGALNPGQNFEKAGDNIAVANVEKEDAPGRVSRIEVDKTQQVLRAFGAYGTLVAFYPVTAGSKEKPAPDGTLKITSVKKNPTYRYNPDYAFKGVHTTKPFTIKPGPNNPVGVVWIGLSSQGYGIHGTPDPSTVGKAQSHGCVRLTNWDALQLASVVKKGIPVEFIGKERAAQASKHRRHRR